MDPFCLLMLGRLCVCVCTLSCSVVSWLCDPWTVAHQVPHAWYFPGINTQVGCRFLFQGICDTRTDLHLLPPGRWFFVIVPPGRLHREPGFKLIIKNVFIFYFSSSFKTANKSTCYIAFIYQNIIFQWEYIGYLFDYFKCSLHSYFIFQKDTGS